MPEAPAQVLEALALLEEAGYLCADLQTCLNTANNHANEIRHTFQVIVRESASPKLLKGTKDLFPCVMRQRVKKMGTVSFVRD